MKCKNMPDEVSVKTGGIAVGAKNLIIKTGSVGSCVVIALYDEVNKIGGLAHAMLPTQRSEKEEDGDSPAKYADEAVDKLVEEIEKAGGNKGGLIAKLVGGAAMFKKFVTHKNIGDQNVISARESLSKYGIHIENEDTGGGMGKSVEMNLATGLVEVKTTL
jgi:chemotaxis protein CheD